MITGSAIRRRWTSLGTVRAGVRLGCLALAISAACGRSLPYEARPIALPPDAANAPADAQADAPGDAEADGHWAAGEDAGLDAGVDPQDATSRIDARSDAAPDAAEPWDGAHDAGDPDADAGRCFRCEGAVGCVNDEPKTSWQSYCSLGCHLLFYAGGEGADTFDLGPLDPPPAGATLNLRIALDDHYDVPAPYCLSISVNGNAPVQVQLSGVPHGSPFGGPFTNFATYAWPLPREQFAQLASGANTFTYLLGCARVGEDWVVVDWSELRLLRPGCLP